MLNIGSNIIGMEHLKLNVFRHAAISRGELNLGGCERRSFIGGGWGGGRQHLRTPISLNLDRQGNKTPISPSRLWE